MDSGIMAGLAQRLATEEPGTAGLRLAAVSVVVRGSENPSLLLIERAERPGDPWSGQIAFPGGKMQEGDGSARGTAVRETREEVGVDLDRSARFLGYSSPLTTHTGTMRVVPAVFQLATEVEVRPNDEVASHLWAELGTLLSPEARTTFQMQFGGEKVNMPAIEVGGYVVWGLTHRIISSLFLEDQAK
jgi:8-oxo-dGTP pyrophosphatase MutT (NUDIX family)